MTKKTTIQLNESTVLRLKKIKGSLSETYDILINKLIDEYEISRDNPIKKD